jgi:hypothetical protein
MVQDLCRESYGQWRTVELGESEYVFLALLSMNTRNANTMTIDKGTVSVTIPKNLPSGDYLLRVEHIALHSASTVGGAQFYISCAQVSVTGGGSGTPSPLVSFPGAYSATDPGIKVNIYSGSTSYTPPGPAVWTG